MEKVVKIEWMSRAAKLWAWSILNPFKKHSCIERIDPAELPALAVGEVSQLDVNLTKVTTVSPSVKLLKMHKINSEFRDWADLSTSQG